MAKKDVSTDSGSCGKNSENWHWMATLSHLWPVHMEIQNRIYFNFCQECATFARKFRTSA